MGRYQSLGELVAPVFVAEATSQETMLSVIGTASVVVEVPDGKALLALDRERLGTQLERVVSDVEHKWRRVS